MRVPRDTDPQPCSVPLSEASLLSLNAFRCLIHRLAEDQQKQW
jgi:hypothetical protein